MIKEAKKPRVIVGMSAGVDSSVAAALLKDQGYDVVGVFLHFWKEPGQDELRENKCCSLESQQDARKVAQILDIPLYTVNAAQDFKKDVVDYFLEETKAGRTPNPCVVCNERIKFNFLFKKMLEMDADYVATGHYANIEKIGEKYHLYTSSDEEKDQTYFLYSLNQNQLSRILFPCGKYKKPQIRKIGEKQNLPVFDKEDSQGLCFTPEKTPTKFIKRNLKLSPGDIITTEEKKIGTHEGLELYTIGQRKGINIGGNGPYFVVDRDFKKNRLIVANNEQDEKIFKKTMTVEIKNWIADEPILPKEVNVKIRYRHPLVRGTLQHTTYNRQHTTRAHKNTKNETYVVEFKEAQKAVTPGQSAVFYADDNEVLGGGTIIG
ncbi:MAG: tRNA-specific 2-thiouridylase MnmA [Candidatus Moranbacteria bacterium GW2011_GWE2_36_40]|nr:MAG: tRNA-specific 2-thiouridylase MnmA [Candidatus Moranbacteria bacterium GW2011_GWE2_36_40]